MLGSHDTTNGREVKSAVFQIRLSPEEKAILVQKAEDRGVSVSRMIRDDYELAVKVAPRLPEPPPEAIVVNEPAPDTEVIEAPSEAPLTPHLAEARKRLGI